MTERVQLEITAVDLKKRVQSIPWGTQHYQNQINLRWRRWHLVNIRSPACIPKYLHWRFSSLPKIQEGFRTRGWDPGARWDPAGIWLCSTPNIPHLANRPEAQPGNPSYNRPHNIRQRVNHHLRDNHPHIICMRTASIITKFSLMHYVRKPKS